MVHFSMFGALVLLVLLLLLLLKKKIKDSLILLLVFLLPFFDTSIFSINELKVLPFHFLGGIVILYAFVSWGLSANFRLCKYTVINYLFIFTIIVSLFIPFVYEGKIEVVSVSTAFTDYGTEPLKFSLSNITQTIYPVFMVILTISIISLVDNVSLFVKMLSAFLFSTFIVALSGFTIQFGFYFWGEAFVSNFMWFFNGLYEVSTVLDRIENYNSFDGFPRMYSLAGEPSFSVTLFLIAIPIALFLFLNKDGRNRRLYLVVFVFLVIAVIFCGSTTGYLGLLLVIFSYIYFTMFFLRKSRNPVHLLRDVFFLITTLFLLALFFSDYLLENHLSKITEGAGSMPIRLQTILVSFEVFSQSILFGVGYGSHRATSMFFALLSNVGLVGVILYFTILLFLVKNIFADLKNNRSIQYRVYAQGMLMSFFVVWPLLLFAIPVTALNFGWHWFLIFMMALLIKLKGRFYESEKSTVAQN